MLACWVLVGVFGTIVLLYALIEVHYFLRMFLTVLLARFCKKPVHILDETTIYGENYFIFTLNGFIIEKYFLTIGLLTSGRV